MPERPLNQLTTFLNKQPPCAKTYAKCNYIAHCNSAKLNFLLVKSFAVYTQGQGPLKEGKV